MRKRNFRRDDRVLHGSLSVVGVEYRKILGNSYHATVATQKTRAIPVKGPEPNRFVATKISESALHFLSRFVGESQRQNGIGRNSLFE